MCPYAFACVCMCAFACVCVCMYVCVRVYVCVCACVYMVRYFRCIPGESHMFQGHHLLHYDRLLTNWYKRSLCKVWITYPSEKQSPQVQIQTREKALKTLHNVAPSTIWKLLLLIWLISNHIWHWLDLLFTLHAHTERERERETERFAWKVCSLLVTLPTSEKACYLQLHFSRVSQSSRHSMHHHSSMFPVQVVQNWFITHFSAELTTPHNTLTQCSLEGRKKKRQKNWNNLNQCLLYLTLIN